MLQNLHEQSVNGGMREADKFYNIGTHPETEFRARGCPRVKGINDFVADAGGSS